MERCNRKVTSTYKKFFKALEREDSYDMTDNVLFVLHYMFLPRINADLEQFRQAWNRHKLSSEGNATPNELMLLNTENDGLQDVNKDDYGVEGEGGDEAEGEDGAHSVVVIPSC